MSKVPGSGYVLKKWMLNDYVLATLIPFPILKYHANSTGTHCSWDSGAGRGRHFLSGSPQYIAKGRYVWLRGLAKVESLDVALGFVLAMSGKENCNVGVMLILFCVLALSLWRSRCLSCFEMSVKISEFQVFLVNSVVSQRKFTVGGFEDSGSSILCSAARGWEQGELPAHQWGSGSMWHMLWHHSPGTNGNVAHWTRINQLFIPPLLEFILKIDL